MLTLVVGCICMIYFQDSKCDTFSLLGNTHDLQNRSRKLNEIHRRILSHWNCHTDSLIFVIRSHHCHQALAMINNATNHLLANWVILGTLSHRSRTKWIEPAIYDYKFTCALKFSIILSITPPPPPPNPPPPPPPLPPPPPIHHHHPHYRVTALPCKGNPIISCWDVFFPSQSKTDYCTPPKLNRSHSHQRSLRDKRWGD